MRAISRAIVGALLLGLIGLAPASATAAGLTIAPQSLSFNRVAVGTASAPKVVRFSNHNSAAIHVVSVALPGNFSLDSDTCSGQTIAPSAHCAVSVTFSPAAAGTFSGNLTIAAAAGNSEIMPPSGAASSTLGTDRRTRLRRQEVPLAGLAVVASPSGILVTNPYINAVTDYPLGSSGDVAPSATIAGDATQLDYPFGIAVDPTGEIYVANYSGIDVTLYAPGSNGNAPTDGVISGPDSGLTNPEGIAVDSNGNVYVANNDGGTPFFGSITYYAADPPPPLPPVITGPKTGLAYPVGIAVDSSANAYVANLEGGINGAGSVTVYSNAQAAAGGNVPPIATITGILTGLGQPSGIAIGPFVPPALLPTPPTPTPTFTCDVGDCVKSQSIPSKSSATAPVPAPTATAAAESVYVANNDCGPSASGCVTVYSLPLKSGTSNPADVSPIATIAGPDTLLDDIEGIAVDQRGYIYVASFTVPGRILIYYPGSNGDVSPIATIAGPDTGLFAPWGLTVDPTGSGPALPALFVANSNGNSSTIYPLTANGNMPPAAAVDGPSTGLDSPTGLAVDSNGGLYLANNICGLNFICGLEEVPPGGSVTVYPPLSNGNVPPTANITGPATGISQPTGVAVDSSKNIYVLNFAAGFADNGAVGVFTAGSNGNVAPIATITGPDTELCTSDGPGVAVDSGANIYVANDVQYFCFDGGENLIPDSITVYPAGSNGDAVPSAIITGPDTGLDNPNGVAVDSAGTLYVTNFGTFIEIDSGGEYSTAAPGGDPPIFDSVTVYPPGSNGDQVPSATIIGPNTGLLAPFGVAVDSMGNIYVANYGSIFDIIFFDNGDDYVTVYPPGSNGNVSPMATISGAATLLNGPWGIALGPS